MTKSEEPLLPQDENSLAKQFGMFVIVLSSFVGSSGAGIGIGWLLWKKAGFPWWIILITALAGLYGASYQVVRYQRVLDGRKGKK